MWPFTKPDNRNSWVPVGPNYAVFREYFLHNRFWNNADSPDGARMGEVLVAMLDRIEALEQREAARLLDPSKPHPL